jgi:hypothetical protein
VLRRTLTVALSVTALVVVLAAPAFAGHDHFIETPNGKCHQVAQGQTSIEDPTHGGYHKFHVNVHLGAADSGVLGHGNSNVHVYREDPPPPPPACS